VERQERIAELGHISIDLLVTINLIGSVIERYPEEIQDNFTQKVESLSKNLYRETEEFQSFAESWDDEVESEDDT
jgi:hypothetical protein